MSYRHLQRFAPMQGEFAAARAAITYIQGIWSSISDLPEMRPVRLAEVRAAERNLEVTYIIRLFSEFEALLYDHLDASRPRPRIPRTAEALINGVALRERVPDPIRVAAQQVREYRNTVVHLRGVPTPVLSFRESVAALNRFLVLLHDLP